MGEPDIPISRIVERIGPAPVREESEDGRGAERRFLEYYGLNEQPFGVTPDPRFLYFGPKHRQALTALTYGTDLNRGFLTLIAKPGMGKTSLLFEYLGGLRSTARTAFLFQTIGDARDLMYYLLTDLGLDATGKSLPEMHSMLNQLLLEEMHADQRLVVVIDEAQNLDEKVLESVRLLSNFETPWMKLMQIVLAGQPQLAEKLAQPSMSQLRQRVSFSIRIDPFTREEIDAYVDHRLWVAGYNGPPLFTVGARTLLAEHSEGIPRNINNICFCAMSLAFATKARTIDREMMRDVLTDMNPGSVIEKPDPTPKSSDEQKQSIPYVLQNPVLTVKDTPSRGWVAKIAIACLLLALSWAGVHFGLGQRLGLSFHDVSAAAKSYLAPAPTPDSLAPGTGTSSETPANDKNPATPSQGMAEVPRSSQRSN